ncbi:hypothetical protein PMAYCL1PPCAC_00699, partial [Pristionchus mayeri]
MTRAENDNTLQFEEEEVVASKENYALRKGTDVSRTNDGKSVGEAMEQQGGSSMLSEADEEQLPKTTAAAASEDPSRTDEAEDNSLLSEEEDNEDRAIEMMDTLRLGCPEPDEDQLALVTDGDFHPSPSKFPSIRRRSSLMKSSALS